MTSINLNAQDVNEMTPFDSTVHVRLLDILECVFFANSRKGMFRCHLVVPISFRRAFLHTFHAFLTTFAASTSTFSLAA